MFAGELIHLCQGCDDNPLIICPGRFAVVPTIAQPIIDQVIYVYHTTLIEPVPLALNPRAVALID